MGVNKGNIHYTFHYGIPSSMESLYQEAGRAGRDKKRFINTKAKCFVIFTKTTNESDLEKLWERKTTIEEMKELQKNITGDIKTNLYLSLSRAESILKESESIKKFFDSFAIANGKKIKIRGTDLKAKTETIIYRLFQLGIIEDWTISKFFGNGEFEVDFSDYSNEKIEKQLYNTISKYDKTFSLDQIGKDKKYAGFQKWLNDKTKSEIEKYILILLQWSYDNFAYNRRQSLKNIYENCSDLTSKKITGAIFKERIENYFKFTETTNLLQHVAEYPKAFNNWFDVFYQISNNKQTTQLITNKEQEALKDNLSRILESYMYSPGLDIISGLTRLMLDDYENLDGRQRFEGSLEFIKKVNKEEQNLIIDKILKIGTTLDSKNKNLMSESMCKYFNTPDILIKMAKSLGDTTSYINYIKSCNTRLKSIKKENN